MKKTLKNLPAGLVIEMRRRGILESFCEQNNIDHKFLKPNVTLEECIIEAKKYTRLVDWKVNSLRTYRAAEKNNWRELCCGHMDKNRMPNGRGFWTLDLCKVEALKYSTKQEWFNGHAASSHAARRNGWYNECTAHMPKKERISWTLEMCQEIVSTNKCHIMSDLKKINKAAYSFIQNRKWQNIIVWNKTPLRVSKNTKGVSKWTDDDLILEAKKYNNRMELKNKSGSAYSHIIKRKLGIIAFAHMNKPVGGIQGAWTDDEIIDEAKKYNTRTEFMRMSGGYAAALKRGHTFLDSVCAHMVYKRGKTLTKEMIIFEALKYNTRGEFRKKSQSAYNAARNMGILEEVCVHMKESASAPWHEDELKKEALKYNNRAEFRKGSSGAYSVAEKRGIMDQICSHMEPKRRRRWTENEILQEAKKYNNKTDFIKNSPGAYNAAWNIGKKFLNKTCAHMISLWVIKDEWTDEKLIAEAKKYNTRIEFKNNSSSAYHKALSKGVLFFNMICAHMICGKREFFRKRKMSA